MKYPEKYMAEGETRVFDVHHHPVVLWWPALAVVVFAGAWIAGLFFFAPLRNDWAVLAGLVVLILLVLYLAWRVVVLLHVNLVLTDRRLIYCHGVFTRQSREAPVSRIVHVSCSQPVTGRLVGAGDITVVSEVQPRRTTFASMGSPELLRAKIAELAHAPRAPVEEDRRLEIEQEVSRAMTVNQPTIEMPPIPPERPPLYTEIVDQIERLDLMRSKGVISDEEFARAKEKLLERLGGGEES